MDHPLDGYYLIRVYRKESGEFGSITDLPKDRAIAKLAEQNSKRGADGNENPVDYMERRLAAEDWARQQARDSGVQVDRNNPVYYALTKDPDRTEKDMLASREVRADPDAFRVQRHALSETDLSRLSFTVDDSISNHHLLTQESMAYNEGPHPLHGRVMSAEQITAAIDRYGSTATNGATRIEAQLWAHEISPSIGPKPVGSPHSKNKRGHFLAL